MTSLSSPAASAAQAPVSVFEHPFDVVIHGGGFIGFAAARGLAARGRSVLLIEPSGQLLWEATRALENATGDEASAGEGGAMWREWLAELRRHGALRGEHFDPAFAEILAARAWAAAGSGVRVLCYARPVAVARSGDGRVAALTLATKAGFREVRARRWIDASERGELAILCVPALRGRRREPTARRHGIVLQGGEGDWARHADALAGFCAELGAGLRRAVRDGERRLVWPCDGTRLGWRETEGMLRSLRAAVPLGEDIVVSQLSAEPFPVYGEDAFTPEAKVAPGLPANVRVLSPALRSDKIDTIAARFGLGAAAALDDAEEAFPVRPSVAERPVATPEVVATSGYDVVVAGTGTAGALAAVAAAMAGARTGAFDFATFPGGVGTGGGITGYFFGLEGGLQEEIDRATTEMNLLLEGASPTTHRWHHEGKKLALLSTFERHGVEFHGGALLCGVERDESGRVEALLVATAEGLVRVRARAFVDSTGDGDLCVQAGAGFDSGREGDGRMLAYSQPAFVWQAESGTGGGGRVATRNFDAGWADPTDPEDLSRARLAGVAQHWRERWSEVCPLAIAPLPGLRQSRHIRTDYTLTFRDLAGGARFADSIGEAGSIADTHSVDYEFEDDEAVFFFWVCRLFRRPLRCELPYRMLIPRGLKNVWIACRAAGVAPTAFYAVRMQRDMQRLGEAAGIAAALAARTGSDSREVEVPALQARLRVDPGRAPAGPRADDTETLAGLAAGRPGAHLWETYREPRVHRETVLRALYSENKDASFYAAAVLAMWADATAEPRLIAAVAAREEGPPPSPDNTGAHGQEIDIPFWLIAVVLLRRCGTEACLPVLGELAERPDNLLNVRTAIALTLERLAADGRVPSRRALAAAELLLEHPISDHLLAPSHSIWRRLRGEAQLVLRNDCGAETRQDHSWQIHLVVGRIRHAAGEPPDARARAYADDPRAIVRQAFARFVPSPVEPAGVR